MSRFYGSMRGGRGEATRCGTPASGLTGHIRGWNVGGRVDCSDRDGSGVVEVYATTGSNAKRCDILLATLTVRDGRVYVQLNKDADGLN